MAGEDITTRKKAVALRYEMQKANAPVILASGSGLLAQRIIEEAVKNGVPLQEDQALVDILSRLEVGMEIPPEVYQVVAEIFASLWKIDAERGKHRIR